MMSNKFDEENIFNHIMIMEDKYKNEIVENGNEAWPITRISIYKSLSTLSQQKKYESIVKNKKLTLRSNISLLGNLKDFITKFLSSKLNLIRNQKKVKNIFFSRSNYLDKLNSKIFFDRAVDPLYITSLVNTESLKLYLDRYWIPNKLFLKGIFFFSKEKIFFNFLNKKLNNEKKDLKRNSIVLLNSFIKLHKLEYLENFLKIDLERDINIYSICKYNAKNFLKKFPTLKKVFVVCWYATDMMAIIAAANELKIETIDVQHGKQGKYQPAYSGWKCTENNEFINLPQYFWCWGERGIKNILKGSEKRSSHIPILGGYAWPKIYKEYINRRDLNNSNAKINLLFTIQPLKGDMNNEPFKDGLLKILKYYDDKYKKGSRNEFNLRVRLHPNYIDRGLFYLKKRLGDLFFSNLFSYSSKNDSCLFDDLSWANHHITFFSTSAIDSISFNIKSAVYGKISYELYSEEIENLSLSHLKDCSYKELKDWLKKKPNIKEGETSYIVNKLPDPILLTEPLNKIK
tara:strand:+ start:758 stop:2305 length:1548 start_codon:yes stop_codon:yes gene_type:complete